MPFDDASFDTVFSKDSIIHIPDKPAFLAEVFRVLRPDGTFAASGWLRGTGPEAEAALARMLAAGHLHFDLATADEMTSALAEAGFVRVRAVDRNAWYAARVDDELRQLTGPLYAGLVASVDKDIVDPWIDLRRVSAEAVIAGGLRPTHLRAVRSA